MDMKIIVIGSTGTIGAAVAAALGREHEVVGVTRKSSPAADLTDKKSLEALFEKVQGVDAVVSCAGDGAFKPLASLTDEDFAFSLRSKLMGQVNLARIAAQHLKDGGSITLTSGVLSRIAMPGAAAISLVNAGLEGFVRSAALDMPRGIRINVVSPPWIKETMVKVGMDPTPGLAAKDAANAYVAAVQGEQQGETLECAAFV
jgi:NAD(P)-dependent dehydrogenase (short-subunit alcohol dehydrogenase family)